MMIGIMTLDPNMYNYGGFLQELALQDALRNLGYETQIINYNPRNERNTFSLKRGIRYFTVEKLINKFREKKYEAESEEITEAVRIRKNAFDSYRLKQLEISEKIDFETLHTGRLPYDIFVCGSDQIWNPGFNIPAFFLDFVGDHRKKIIYGASIGRDYLTKLERTRYQELIVNPDFISVRERSAKEIIESISRKEVYLVLDPTLLHTEEYWDEKVKSSIKCYKNYVFCYFLELTDEKIKAAEDFAKQWGYRIVTIPYLHGVKCPCFGDIQDSDVGPADFLGLIKNAEVILTDSFHAAVFSLILGKEFWVFGRNAGSYNMNTRIDMLLEYYDAKERMITPGNLYNATAKMKSYPTYKIERAREESLKFLWKALKHECTDK